MFYAEALIAIHAIARKVNIKAVSERLGHASIERTLETYTYVLPTMQAEAVEMLGAIAYSTPNETKLEGREQESLENGRGQYDAESQTVH